jgi:hypothetical protein
MRESHAVLQVPLWQTRLPELQLPLQQGWLSAPHETQALFTQVLLPEHDDESQTQLPLEQCRPLPQLMGVPAQLPLWQVSFWVQASPSLQVPPVLGGLLQVPVDGLQVPTVWQTSSAVQTTGFWCWQVPTQTSEPLQGFASSLQVVPPQQAWPMPPH